MVVVEGHLDAVAGKDWARELGDRIRSSRATVAVVGQGFVGIPQAIEIAAAGFRVIGVDRDTRRVEQLNAGSSPVPDVPEEQLRRLLAEGAYRATASFADLGSADVVVVCVPTPLTPDGEPDLSLVDAAISAIAEHLRRPSLIVLESTVPPGTTRSLVLPRLAAGGRVVGRDFFLGFAPERLDPGNRRYTMTNTPRLVSGMTAECLALSEAFYGLVVDEVKPVSAPEIAELAKAVENTFRFINISFANEVAQLCDRLGYSVWDVVDAAATKPFAFMPHYPGPGVGGSCIPVVPHYLRHVAAESGVSTRMVEAAVEVNSAMPGFVVAKLRRLLAERGTTLTGASVLVVGASYKADVADLRESPALPILRTLRELDVDVDYHDPLIPALVLDSDTLRSVALTSDRLGKADCVLLLTLHSSLDRTHLLRHARFIFDTRNALRAGGDPKVALL